MNVKIDKMTKRMKKKTNKADKQTKRVDSFVYTNDETEDEELVHSGKT